jgi:uncharacterized protein YcnI
MRRAAATISAAAAGLAFGPVAHAHVTAVPTFVTAGQRQTITLVAPNERQARMTGFSVTVPDGLSIVDAPASDGGWPGTFEEATATWAGCCVAPGAIASFTVALEASGDPGDVRLDVDQHYPDGQKVRWPVALTVLPGEKSSSSLGVVLLVAALGLVLTVGLVLLAWRRVGSAPTP